VPARNTRDTGRHKSGSEKNRMKELGATVRRDTCILVRRFLRGLRQTCPSCRLSAPLSPPSLSNHPLLSTPSDSPYKRNVRNWEKRNTGSSTARKSWICTEKNCLFFSKMKFKIIESMLFFTHLQSYIYTEFFL